MEPVAVEAYRKEMTNNLKHTDLRIV